MCDQIETYDLSPTAVQRVRRRCRHLRNLNINLAALETRLPIAADLYLLCEVGYYMEKTKLAPMLAEHVAVLAPGATLLARHWLGHSPYHRVSGDDVHDEIGRAHV